jgi:hypothetical protein
VNQHPANLSPAAAWALAQSSDHNQDGYLSREEWIHWWTPEFSLPVLRAFADEYLATHDADADGKLGLREFLNATLTIASEDSNRFSAQSFDHRYARWTDACLWVNDQRRESPAASRRPACPACSFCFVLAGPKTKNASENSGKTWTA